MSSAITWTLITGRWSFLAEAEMKNTSSLQQELLLSSPTGGNVEYLAGVFYQDEDLKHDRYTDAVLSAGRDRHR